MLDRLPAAAQHDVLTGLDYCNLQELRAFCREHAVPFAIYIELPSGERRRSKDIDRKSVVVARIRTYLTTGKIPPATCFAADVVASKPLPTRLRANDRLFYGWYDKHHPALVALLRRLTGGRFKNGAIARILMREFWSAGKAPTFSEFAEAWEEAATKGLSIAEGAHPEAAYLTDRARGEAGADWKQKRTRIATRVLELLAKLSPARPD